MQTNRPSVAPSGTPGMRPTLLALAIQALALTLLASPGASHAQQQAPAATTAYDIPAGLLADTLSRFAQASGSTVSFDAARLQALSSPGLKGSYGVEDGYNAILRGSGFAVGHTPTGYALVPQGQASAGGARAGSDGNPSLAAVTVSAHAERSGTTEGSGSYTTESMETATRLRLSIRETPQSVSVVTRQQMDDLGIQSVEDITHMTTGLTLSKGATERAGFYSRGFSINYFTQDGLPMSSDADTLGFSTLSIYDRIEVVRGAAGLLTGAGNPAGSINFVRKRPTREAQVVLTGSAGRWNDYRAELDAGGPLNEAGTLRGRAVVALQDAETFISNYSHRRALVYATVDADLSRDTRLSVGFHYNEEKNPGSTWYGLPTAYNGSFLPMRRSANTAPDWTFWNKGNTRFFAELEHDLGSEWKVKLSGQVLKDTLDSVLNGTARVRTTEMFTLSSANAFIYDRDQTAFNVQAGGPLNFFGRRHDVVFGATRRTREQDDQGFNAPGYSYTFDPVNWNTAAPPEPPLTNLYFGSTSQTKQTGFYATGRFKLADPLAVLLGARMDWYDYTAVNPLTRAVSADYRIDREVTPYGGIVFDLNDTYSLYGSWTSVFNPQSAVDQVGKLLPPVTGINVEAGIKGEYFGGALNASAALFKVKQQNLAQSLPASSCRASISCAEAAGEVQSKGFELELAGAMTPDWQLSAGYTYNTAKYTRDSSAGKAGTRFATDRPSKLFRLATSYRLPGTLNAWRIGGALRSQNEMYKTNNAIYQGGYTILDLTLGWQVNKQLDLNFGIRNLFDKTYYQAISTVGAGNAFGEPRNFFVTAKYKFQ